MPESRDKFKTDLMQHHWADQVMTSKSMSRRFHCWRSVLWRYKYFRSVSIVSALFMKLEELTQAL